MNSTGQQGTRGPGRRSLRLIGVIGILTLVLAACGGAEDPEADEGAAPEPAAPAETEADGAAGEPAADTSPAEGEPAGAFDLPEPELTSLEFGISALEFHSFPLHYASVTGILEEYGITSLNETYTEGVASAIQALAGGQLDVQAGTGSSVLSSLPTDTPFITIATTLSKLTDGLFGGEGITTTEDIRGQRIAISQFGGESHAAVVLALKEAGMTPEDVEITQIGGQSDRIAAVIGGSVAAAPIDIAIRSQMEDEGLTLLVNLAESDQALPRGGLNVTREWMEQNPNTALALVAATMEAIQLMDENREAAVDAHMEWAEVTDRAESEAALDSYMEFVEEDLVIGEQPWLDMRDVLAETNPAVADVDVTEGYTTEFVEQLEEMGFLEQLGVQIEE